MKIVRDVIKMNIRTCENLMQSFFIFFFFFFYPNVRPIHPVKNYKRNKNRIVTKRKENEERKENRRKEILYHMHIPKYVRTSTYTFMYVEKQLFNPLAINVFVFCLHMMYFSLILSSCHF